MQRSSGCGSQIALGQRSDHPCQHGGLLERIITLACGSRSLFCDCCRVAVREASSPRKCLRTKPWVADLKSLLECLLRITLCKIACSVTLYRCTLFPLFRSTHFFTIKCTATITPKATTAPRRRRGDNRCAVFAPANPPTIAARAIRRAMFRIAMPLTRK